MFDAIIRFSVTNKLIVMLGVLGLIGWGIYGLQRIPIDAVPDITNNQVQVITVSPTLAPQEMEQYVTFPVELAMANIQHVAEIRSVSKYGLSVVTVVFDEAIPVLDARQRVGEQIDIAAANIPEAFGRPEMMPITTGLGEIFQYTLEPLPGYEAQYDAMALRTMQDWIVKRYLSGIPGIVEISSFGGYVKQFEVSVKPEQLQAMDITINEVMEALRVNNQNTGGSYLERGTNALYIRAEGLVKDLADIAQIVITTRNGLPVRVRDVATVKLGHPPRYGAMTQDGKGEAVGGITLMFKGANSNEVIGKVKQRIQEVQAALPEGVEIQPYLDRSGLVARTIDTVRNNLIEGGLIVIFILVLLLGNFRAGLIVASVIPLSMLFAIGMMHVFGVSANLMSLGAIDFGLIVDGAVIIVESIVYNLQQRIKQGALSSVQREEVVLSSAIKIRKSAAFGEIIILMVYLPILTLEGVEGKMFIPMAQTVSFAILGALLLSLTYVPAASSIFLRFKHSQDEKPDLAERLVHFLYRGYKPLLQRALAHRRLVLLVAMLLFGGSVWVLSRMGGEFIPQLDEGDLAMQMSVEPGSALSHSIRTATKAERILLTHFPEVKKVVSKIGTAEVPTDPMGVEDADIMIILKDRDEWQSAPNKEALIAMMKQRLEVIEEASFEFTQPIELRFNELLTGSKAELAVKLFGEDLETLASNAREAARIIRTVPGASDVKVDRTEGLPQIMVSYKRERLAAYGLSIEQVNQAIQAAFAGGVAGMVMEGERRFELAVRLDAASRQEISDLKTLYVRLPRGGKVPLAELADVRYEEGPMQISREDTKRFISIGVNVRGRDIASLVEELQLRLDEELALPPGYVLTYGGQFENLQRASQRLGITVPMVLFIIFILLFMTFGSIRQSLMIFSAIPLAAIGGVLALWLRGMPFSISAGIGFIALFGVAVLNGIVLIGYFNQLEQEGWKDMSERILEGTRVRLRPVIMTAAVASLGFLPMALSRTAGAEVQRPLATVVIGGLITATLLTLFVLPVIYSLFMPNPPLRPSSVKAKALATALLMATAVGSVRAQPDARELGLEEAEALLLQQNPMLQQEGYRLEQAQVQIKTAWDLGETQLNFQRGQLNTEAVDNYWGVQQPLGKPLEMHARKQWRSAQVELAQSRLSARQYQQRFQLHQLYHEWQYLRQQLQLLSQQAEAYEEWQRIARLQYQVGERDTLSSVFASTQLAALTLRQEQLRTRLRIQARRFSRLLGSEERLQPASEEMGRLRLIPAPDSLASWGQRHPLLKQQQQVQVVSERALQAEQARFSPSLSLGYFQQQIDQQAGFRGVTAGLSVPLWFGPQRARSQIASLEVERQGDFFQAQRLALSQQLEALSLSLEQAVNTLKYFEEVALEQAEVMLRVANLRYVEGEQSYLPYAQALEQATRIRLDYLDALWTHNQLVLQINFFAFQ